jgi:hypothetical protein
MKPYAFAMSVIGVFLAAFAIISLSADVTARAEYPKPSPYPISWELKFDHSQPQRIVVKSPGDAAPQAYWFMTYSVTNNTDREQTFLPVFEMVTQDGKVIRSDNRISAAVFDAIKRQVKDKYLEPFTKVGGDLLIGGDQTKDGVAIWKEPMARMGQFSIYVQGLSGEAVNLKDDEGKEVKTPDGNPVILRKTLQLNYFIRGDDVYPGEDEVNANPEQWVMR